MYRIQGSINSAQGPALSGVQVYICTQPAVTSSIPPSPLATLYTDATGGTVLANPVLTDGLGNWFAYAPTALYTLVIVDPLLRIPTTIFPDQACLSPGGGSVTSVAIVVPAEFSVSGSPILNAGTITITKATQTANTVYCGPASGIAAVPAFRALVSADMPSGLGSVSSVTLAASVSPLLTASITGTNPITTSGTFTLNLSFATQAANTFLAGPASGGSGAITARLLVPADLPPQVATVFSATPVFNSLVASSFQITLTGNVTSSTVSNPTAGQEITFIITQDGTGGRTFAWPADFRGANV